MLFLITWVSSPQDELPMVEMETTAVLFAKVALVVRCAVFSSSLFLQPGESRP